MTLHASQFLNAEQITWIWTAWGAESIRELARKGKLPVAFWVGKEPLFSRDMQTVLAMTRLTFGGLGRAA